ncbi:MAG: hypothetical protein ACE148_13980 [Vicinamibacterales bacterium]
MLAFITPILTIGSLMPVRPSVLWMTAPAFDPAGDWPAGPDRLQPATPAAARAMGARDRNWRLLLTVFTEDMGAPLHVRRFQMLDGNPPQTARRERFHYDGAVKTSWSKWPEAHERPPVAANDGAIALFLYRGSRELASSAVG